MIKNRIALLCATVAVGAAPGFAIAQQAPSTAAPQQAPSAAQLPPVQVIQEKPKPKPKAAAKKVVPKKVAAPKPAPQPAPAPQPVAAAPAGATVPLDFTASGGGSPSFGTAIRMSPVAGSEIPVEKVPAAVGMATSADIVRSSQPTVENALQASVPGVILNDAQGNTFNFNVQYRGFEASPVNGFPQGLAVYQNGVRINESFGDIVNFDALPSNAVSDMTVMGSNPVFGLNAVGGALSIVMKDGFQFQGAEIDGRMGSFGRRQVGVQAGQKSGPMAVYFASEAIHDNGYRDFSSTNIRRAYGDIGVKSGSDEVHLSFTGAKNDFGVTAAAPLELLDQSRSLTFTSPQTTRNEVAMLQLNGTTLVTPTTKLSGVLYTRRFKQKHVDGNLGEFAPCTANPADLCDEADQDIEDIFGNNPGYQDGLATIDRTRQDARSYGGSAQVTEKSRLFGLPNQFLIGASFDHGKVRYGANSELGLLGDKLVVNGLGVTLGDDFMPRNLNATNDYIGAYFSNTLDVTSSLALTVGGRYNFARIELEDQTGNFPDLNAKHSFQRFNPMAGATYKIMPGLSLYGGYSEANRAPTASELACSDPANPCIIESFLVDDPPLKQVVSRTFEAGVKGELNGLGLPARLSWSLGFFHTLNQDDIISVNSPDQAGRGYFLNAGDTQRQGIEFSVAARSERLTAYLGYNYIDATFRDTLEIASPNNEFAGFCSNDPTVHCSHVGAGDKLPGVSAHKVKVGAEYAILPQWKVGADWIWASSQYFYGDEGNVAPKLGSRSRVDLHTTYDLTKNITVYGIVNNLFNTKYNTFGTFYSRETLDESTGGAMDFHDPRSVVPAQPLAAYGGVKVKF
jgi:outer membrane receptor protein involved in Fe transport